MSPSPHYDKIARPYAAARRTSQANWIYYDYWSEAMLDAAPARLSDAIALDCMCGSGELARVAKRRVRQLHGADISLGILREVSGDVQPDSLVCADATCLPYGTGCFDLVVVRGGLHHVRNRFEDVLAELARVLRPDGWLVCCEPADENPVVQAFRWLLHHLSDLYEEGERGFKSSELKSAFQETGFEDIRVLPFGYAGYTLIGNTDVLPWFSGLQNLWVIRLLVSVDRISPHIPLWRRLALAYIVVGRAARR